MERDLETEASALSAVFFEETRSHEWYRGILRINSKPRVVSRYSSNKLEATSGIEAFFLRDTWHSAALTAQVAAFGGLVDGRLLGLVVDGDPEALIFMLIAAESTGVLVGTVALWLLSKASVNAETDRN